MSSSTASTSLVSPAVLAAQAYVPKLDMFLASFANIGPEANQKMVVQAKELWKWCCMRYEKHKGADWLAPFETPFAPILPLLEDQLTTLLEDEIGGLTLWTELSLDSKVDVYVKPLMEIELDRQACWCAEAAKQQSAELLLEEEQALLRKWAALMASTMAAGQAAGFLALETSVAGMSIGSPIMGLVATRAMMAVAGGAEVVSEPSVLTVEAVVAGEGESADKSDDQADNEDKAPVTPKRAPTAGGSGPSPAVMQRASKSTTPSRRHSQKVVPQY
ncbi:hypothetical protein C0992_006303 [Termitomyces sp. T32_za158]|nr:hypothetical protein C0992_006303 [Termitomyces sp. T32_za158]